MSLHFSEQPVRRGLSTTVCRRRVPFDELASHIPTCPDCLAWWNDDRSAEDVFGSPTVGTQVHSTLRDSLAGYTPKER